MLSYVDFTWAGLFHLLMAPLAPASRPPGHKSARPAAKWANSIATCTAIIN